MGSPRMAQAILNTGPFELAQQLSTDRKASFSLIRRVRGLAGIGTSNFTQNHESRVLLGVISNVSRALATEGRVAERRTLLVISEGGPLGPTSAEGRPPHGEYVLLQDYRRVMAEAALANLAVYCIDPRGLQVPLPEIKGDTDAAVAMLASAVGREAGDATMLTRFGLLRQIADNTGGTLVDERNGLSAGLPGMIRDSRQYYRLSYALPPPDDGPSKPRSIDVRVKRPNTVVRHRRTYSSSPQ